jgi:hypothetical protein
MNNLVVVCAITKENQCKRRRQLLMENKKEKRKKWLIVMGGVMVSGVLIIMIGMKFKKEPIKEVTIPQQEIKTSDVRVDKPKESETMEQEVTVAPIKIQEETQQDKGEDNAGTEQKIQKDVPKKQTYTEEQLTNPTQKPNGEDADPPKKTKKDTIPTVTPKPKKKDTIPTVTPKPKKEDTTPTATPKPIKKETKTEVKTETKTEDKTKTDTSGGLPGFDNVPDGGENQVIYGDSDGDINKQVGDMD